MFEFKSTLFKVVCHSSLLLVLVVCPAAAAIQQGQDPLIVGQRLVGAFSAVGGTILIGGVSVCAFDAILNYLPRLGEAIDPSRRFRVGNLLNREVVAIPLPISTPAA